MKIFKRIGLFLLVNLAIIIVFSGVLMLVEYFGYGEYLTVYGLNFTSLLLLAVIIGFGGSFISLLLSKKMAKWIMNVQIIDNPRSDQERKLFKIITTLAQHSAIKTPEIGIYPSKEVNAFATGASKNNSLIAVSEGLLEKFNDDELEGVLGHEMAHITNGDMITLTLIQGVVNTFVIFLARAIAMIINKVLSRGDGDGLGFLAYFGLVIVFEIIFGILASILVLSFSRHREFRADRGSAQYVGKTKMIKALQKLQQLKDHIETGKNQKAFAALKISDRPSFFGRLFSSHPSLQRRIEALQNTSV